MNEFRNDGHRDWEDMPEINFEIRNDACRERAQQFAEQADRLTVDREVDEDGKGDDFARRYYLEDGDTIDVNYQNFADDEGSISVIVWTKAPYEAECSDGQRRRAVCSRTYTFDDTPIFEMEPEALAELHEATQKAMKELEKVGYKPIDPEEERAFIKSINEQNFQIAMGDMEIPEEITIKTQTKVEVKLPNSPNYTTERSEMSGSEEKERNHLEMAFFGEIHSGFGREAEYSPREHDLLMEVLGKINPTETPPTIGSFD